MALGKVFLLPSLLTEDGLAAIPTYIADKAMECQVFFVEEERTARRYLKKIRKEIVIDNYEWYTMEEAASAGAAFKQKLKEGKTIGIISEAGCPGVADPGQALVAIAHQMNVQVIPLVGPSSILLALMASGMNGQQFRFAGYLPIDSQQRIKAIKDLEVESARNNCTQIFIETPYRNNQMIGSILQHAKPSTQLCIAVDLTGAREWIKTQLILDWQKDIPDIHKRPAIFLLYSGNH
jgi:16S rRNA (cytidine1402-2'-O)-methyltransferase